MGGHGGQVLTDPADEPVKEAGLGQTIKVFLPEDGRPVTQADLGKHIHVHVAAYSNHGGHHILLAHGVHRLLQAVITRDAIREEDKGELCVTPRPALCTPHHIVDGMHDAGTHVRKGIEVVSSLQCLMDGGQVVGQWEGHLLLILAAVLQQGHAGVERVIVPPCQSQAP